MAYSPKARIGSIVRTFAGCTSGGKPYITGSLPWYPSLSRTKSMKYVDATYFPNSKNNKSSLYLQ